MRIVMLALLVWVGVPPLHASAAPLHAKDVFCDRLDEDPLKCGTMEIDTYEGFTENAAFESKFWFGGAKIAGKFKVAEPARYRYLQSDKNDADQFRWAGDATVALPQPFIDPPPGGYKARADATDVAYTDLQAFDTLPWYDGSAFPAFEDGPGGYFLLAKGQGDTTLTNTFETWLICLIDEIIGPDHTIARDDSYTIAPLLGWQWGYDITYKDVGTLGVDEFGDFTVTPRAFKFLDSPTAHWTDALTAKYGAAGPAQDFWKITVDPDCEECFPVPEPTGGVLVLVGIFALLCRSRWRTRPIRCFPERRED